MREYHMSMLDFWSQFTSGGTPVPAYVKGRVPPGASFPYITFECPIGSFGGKNILTAFNWHQEKNNVNVMAERAALLEQIARAIPLGGTTIEWDGGGAVLRRNDSNFQSYYDVESEKPEGLPVIGGRTSFEVSFFNV